LGRGIRRRVGICRGRRLGLKLWEVGVGRMRMYTVD
jgi:hypothetical protein